MAQPDKKIKVAVVGGGMGGLCAAIGLLKHDHLEVNVYEAAHHFSEIGAGVAFGPNAQRTLRLLGKETEEAYLRLVTHNGWHEQRNVWFEYRYGMGPKEGELIATPKNETGQSTVHRAKFLDEFVRLVPKEIAHFGKRLERIDEEAESLHLHFKDGTDATADCVIGADGVHSAVRRHILGDDHPALDPVFTGSVAYRGLVPMRDAEAALGERFAQNSTILVGQGGCIMTYPIDFGAIMNVVAINSSYKHWDGPWVQKAEYSKIAGEFSAWGSQAQKLLKLLDTPETAAWSMWDDPRAPTFFKGRVVMIGDAAHASTPFQGQGAGQAIEDAYVLSSLFASVDTVHKIAFACQAYDKIRRPRSQRVCETSREAGELCALRLPGVEDNAESFKENIDWRMDWMWHRDIAGERTEALGLFDSLLEDQATLT
nr:6-methylsalicylic acid decarboxylase ata [Quercus suber]